MARAHARPHVPDADVDALLHATPVAAPDVLVLVLHGLARYVGLDLGGGRVFSLGLGLRFGLRFGLSLGLPVISVLVGAQPRPPLTGLVGIGGPPSQADVPGALGHHDDLYLVLFLQYPPQDSVVIRDFPPSVEALLNGSGLHRRS